jgi:DNA-binding response OmpR family regulator
MSLARILVVEADSEVAALLRDTLTGLGHDSQCIGNGFQALRLLETYPADVVLLDYQLPGMSAGEVLEVLRRHYPEIPVVIVAGDGDEAGPWKALDLGAFDYLRKPFNLDDLERILQAAVAHRGRPRA